jgi:hypothetical protein
MIDMRFMAYESRKGRSYYYRKVWKNGQCRSEYIGGGEAAALIARMEQLDQQGRDIARQDRRAEREQFAALAATPPELVALLAEARRASAEALEAAGYHRHKRGEWRKRRGSKDKDQDQSISD